jgi:probable phosphoglycerate mutase
MMLISAMAFIGSSSPGSIRLPPTHPILDIRYWILDPTTRPLTPQAQVSTICRIQHPASSIQHPASSIQHPASSIEHRVSSIEYRASRVFRAPDALSLSAMKRALELWLVRHGETTYSASKRVAGWSDPPLTENGRRQARALRGVIDGQRFAGVWSSDLERAVESARLAFGEPQMDRRLRECHFGSLEGCTYEVADSTYGDVFHLFRGFQAPQGESHEEFSARVHDFVGELDEGRHILFVHGGVIRVLTQDLGVDRFIPTGGLLALDCRAGEVLFIREPGNTGGGD